MQQDAGLYHCKLQIRNSEGHEFTIHGRRNVKVDANVPPVATIVPIVAVIVPGGGGGGNSGWYNILL